MKLQRPALALTAVATLCTCGPTLTAYDPQPRPVVVDLGYQVPPPATNASTAPVADDASVAISTANCATGPCVDAGTTTDASGTGSGAARVQRLGVRPGNDVASSGAVQLQGGPEGANEMSVVDGEIQTEPSRRGQPARVAGGHVVLQDAQGVRHEADVAGGELDTRRDGAPGRHRLRVAGGHLDLREPTMDGGAQASGNANNADGGADATAVASSDNDAGNRSEEHADGATALASASNDGGPPAHVQHHRRALSTHERTALDRLARAHRGGDGGGADSVRQESAARAVADNVEDGPPTFYGIPIVGHSLVVLIDVSYSMREPDPHAETLSSDPAAQPTKLDMVRAQLVQFLASLPGDIAVDVVAFSSEPRALWDQPRTLDESALDQAVDWVAALRPLDETHPLDAIRRADAMHPEQMILLTDGRPTYADSEEPALLHFADSVAARNARLDAVGIGPDQNGAFLDALAARARGMAVHL